MDQPPGSSQAYDWDTLVQEDRVHRLLYTDPGIFQTEMTQIFGGTWVFLAHESQIPERDHFITTHLGLRPIIVIRDSLGEVRALYNRCTHRGTTLCRLDRGSTKTFQCPYHGWTFFNTGKLSGVPWPDGYATDFSDAKFNLAQVSRVQTYRGFIFGTLNPEAPPLLEHLGPVRQPIDQWLDRFESDKIVFSGANRIKYRGNWKLAYDNSADGYHVAFSHRSLLDMENRLAEEGSKGMSFYRKEPDQSPMYVQYLGHGHHFKDKRPGVENRPGALWESEGAHPGMEHYQEKLRAQLGDKADKILDDSASTPVNINIFPNLLILGNHVQVIEPVCVDETNLTWHATALPSPSGSGAVKAPNSGLVDDLNTLRMRTQESFPNFGEVDDVTNFEEIQHGLRALEDEWIYMHRGLGVPGRVQKNADGTIRAPATDEMFMREYIHEWKRLMESKHQLTVKREP